MVSVAPPAEVQDNIVNPERGFYKGLNLLTGATSAVTIRSAGYSLAIALVKLDAFRTGPIDAATLKALDDGLRIVRGAGIKVILRFRYNSDSTGTDAPLSVVLNHIKQLTPIIQANSDVIYVMQAGFIGAWGEWHTSTNGLTTTASERAIVDALLAALPPNRQVQVRTPMAKDAMYPGGPATARDGSARSRVGHHNDCFLASASDYGTYLTPYETWLSYVAKDTVLTSVGGETCAVYVTKTACAPAQAEMARLHYSYLNSEYKLEVINGWNTGGCLPAVTRSLGYRFAVTRLAVSEHAYEGGDLYVQLDVANRGYAAMVNPRPVYLVLTNGTVRHIERIPADPRDWAPGTTTTLNVRVPLPAALVRGQYKMLLWMPDESPKIDTDPRYSVRLANVGGDPAGNPLGTVTVEAKPLPIDAAPPPDANVDANVDAQVDAQVDADPSTPADISVRTGDVDLDCSCTCVPAK